MRIRCRLQVQSGGALTALSAETAAPQDRVAGARFVTYLQRCRAARTRQKSDWRRAWAAEGKPTHSAPPGAVESPAVDKSSPIVIAVRVALGTIVLPPLF